jgi:hypothetical protein
MSPPEIGWRLRGQVSAAWESRRAGQERFQSLSEPRGQALRGALSSSLSALIPDSGWRQTMAAEFPAAAERLERGAGEILAGRVPVYARRVDLGRRVNWHRDPVSGVVAPRRPAALLDYRKPELVGNARRVWEINRHHHLAELTLWAWLAEDYEAAGFAVSQLLDWCEQNPPLIGVNWTSSLELAIRTLAWAEILALLLDMEEPALDDSALELLTGAWIRQIEYVRAHDSRYSSANNHRIGEAAAVAAAGLLLPFHRRAEEWWRWGSSVLDREVLLQFTSDGVGAEQAFAYQRFVLDFVLLVRVLARRQGKDLDPASIERIGQAAEFLDVVTREDGSGFAVGDDDEGRAFALGEAHGEMTLATLECAGWLYDQPAWRRGRFPRACWLGIAGDGARPADAPAKVAALEVKAFPEGGYAVVRDGRGDRPMHLLFDAGPLGYGALAAHGHADALSLCLWAGEDLLIDPGTGSYHGDTVWREALRGTDAHNTCRLDDRDQSERRGLFLWGQQRARGRLLAAGANQPWFILAGSHDGYRPVGVGETRRLIAGHSRGEAVTVLVVDEFLGTGRHQVRLPWHLGPGRPEAGAGGFSGRFPGGTRIEAHTAVLGGAGQPVVAGGFGEEGGGWYAPRFEEREPQGRVEITAELELPAALVTVMIVAAGAAPRVEGGGIRIAKCEGGLNCEIESGSRGTLRALVAHPLAGEVTDGRATVKGRLAAWREGEAASGKAVVAGATAFQCGLLSWKSTDVPITGVLSALAARAESFTSSTNRTGSGQ